MAEYNVKNCNFSDFESLNNFIKISDWESKNPNIEAKIKSLVHEHLNLLQQNFEAYFPIDDYLNLTVILCYGLCSRSQMKNLILDALQVNLLNCDRT